MDPFQTPSSSLIPNMRQLTQSTKGNRQTEPNSVEYHFVQPLNPEPCILQPSIAAVNRGPETANRFSVVCGSLRVSAVNVFFQSCAGARMKMGSPQRHRGRRERDLQVF
jgi:hypothetical protein